MSATMTLIETRVLSSATAEVTFSNIPQNYTDLLIVSSALGMAGTAMQMTIKFNGSSGDYSLIGMYGTGLASGFNAVNRNSYGYNMVGYFSYGVGAPGSTELYFPNYTSSSFKSVLANSTSEAANAANDFISCIAGLWSQTSPINSISLSPYSGTFNTGSSFYIYGITQSDNYPGTFGIQATGGNVTISGGYKYHVFKSSGTFTVNEPGFAEVLAVAGGGGGGGLGGGAGGGGVLTLGTHRRINSGSYPVLVGAGGPGVSANSMTSGNNGNDSSVAGIVAIGGGGGGTYGGTGRGNDGGSGGGAGTSGVTASSGISGQGNNGGIGFSASSPNAIHGGGGGGYSAVGGNAGSFTGGNGGQGYSLPTDLRPLLDNFTVVSSGGGGGARFNTFSTNGTPGTGGTGAGNGSTNGANAGSATTYGSAGGGSGQTAPSGTWGASGSGYQGIVIIRYPVS
jgi:hypothetical protein